ncbi:hypothetical protein MRX96_022417 [Rhipicephalus microplus]
MRAAPYVRQRKARGLRDVAKPGTLWLVPTVPYAAAADRTLQLHQDLKVDTQDVAAQDQLAWFIGMTGGEGDGAEEPAGPVEGNALENDHKALQWEKPKYRAEVAEKGVVPVSRKEEERGGAENLDPSRISELSRPPPVRHPRLASLVLQHRHPHPPVIPVQPHQLILGSDVLCVYLQILVELQCPISCCSVRHSGANWTSRVQSTHRHVEFQHLKPVNDRIYVC